MSLDKIIVIAMAVAFFGGIIWLGIKSRQNASNEGQPSSSPNYNREEDSSLEKSREKERRKSNR